MTLLDPGQAKTDTPPLAGIAGALWTALSMDTDSSVHANLVNLSPCPGTLTLQQIKNRKNLAVMLESIGKAFGVVFSVGTGTIAHLSNNVVLSDSKITTSSLVIPFVTGNPDSACLSLGSTPGTGSVTITGNANVASTFGLAVGYFAINA